MPSEKTVWAILDILMEWLLTSKEKYGQEVQTKIYKMVNTYEEIKFDINRGGKEK